MRPTTNTRPKPEQQLRQQQQHHHQQQQQRQTRSLYISSAQALDMLTTVSIPVRQTPPGQDPLASKTDFSLSLTVDRNTLSPCFVTSPTPDFERSQSQRFPFPYGETPVFSSIVGNIVSSLKLPQSTHSDMTNLVNYLWQIFRGKEAYLLEVRLRRTEERGLEVLDARFGFDDAAFRSSGRQEDVHKLRRKEEEVSEEVEAEKDGIVYVKYVFAITLKG